METIDRLSFAQLRHLLPVARFTRHHEVVDSRKWSCRNQSVDFGGSSDANDDADVPKRARPWFGTNGTAQGVID